MPQLEPPVPSHRSTTQPPAPTSAPATGSVEATPVEPQLDAATIEQLHRGQRFGPAVGAGAAAAVIGASVWAGITVATEYQIGWMAVGVGALVGFAMRRVGRGVETRFGVAAALLALVGCVAGNLLASIGFLAQFSGTSFFLLLGSIDAEIAASLLEATFAPMDLLFYAIAVTEAFKLSFTRVPPAH